MKPPSIKICGVTRDEDITQCEKHKIEYIGLNFVPTSKRFLNLEDAKALRSQIHTAKVVGVFANEPIQNITTAVELLELDCVQLHGDEDLDVFFEIGVPIIKAFRGVPSQSELDVWLLSGAAVMIDGPANGVEPDWDAVAELPEEVRSHMFIAGGLTPDNISEIQERIGPFGVDCASGVESSAGVKDPAMMEAFVNAVRGT